MCKADWKPSSSADIKMKPCTHAEPGSGRAAFGVQVHNIGDEALEVSVVVAYFRSEDLQTCPVKSDPWRVVIAPGDTWWSGLNSCSVGHLHGSAVQSAAWAVTGNDADPRQTAEHQSSPTVSIKSDGTVVVKQ
ncbi:hypothetical protein OG726_51210 [Streptomyces sp. NBC_01373]|nr:hypothetical protein [Streptomyces sp. NBC_01373]